MADIIRPTFGSPVPGSSSTIGNAAARCSAETDELANGRRLTLAAPTARSPFPDDPQAAGKPVRAKPPSEFTPVATDHARQGVEAFHEAARKRIESVSREMLQSQVEICTPPSDSFSDTSARLGRLREDLAELGLGHGLLIFAAGTHPSATWADQKGTEAERYKGIIDDLRMIGRRSVVCGLHVHVEVPRPEARIDMINRLMPFLPILLALSTSILKISASFGSWRYGRARGPTGHLPAGCRHVAQQHDGEA